MEVFFILFFHVIHLVERFTFLMLIFFVNEVGDHLLLECVGFLPPPPPSAGNYDDYYYLKEEEKSIIISIIIINFLLFFYFFIFAISIIQKRYREMQPA